MSNQVEEKIKELTKAYAAQLPNKISEIDAAWKTYRQDNDKNALAAAKSYAHKLAGTAGTYGYSLVSEVAHKLEQNLRIIEDRGVTNKLIAENNNLIQDLKQIVLKAPEQEVKQLMEFEVEQPNVVHLIYILDPDKKDFSLLKDIIKQFNYEVTIFDDIAEFLNAINVKRADLIIMDISLAEQLSDDTLQKFKNELILVIYTSPNDELSSRLFTIRNGGQAFVVKPIDVNFLLKTIENLFEARQLRNERIMIVDDSEFLADYYSMILEHAGLMTKKISDPTRFLGDLLEFQPDLILMDINMPFSSGTELAQIVQQQETLSAVPIIFLSTITERSKQLEVLSHAGDDFLTKPVEPKHLLAAVRNRLMRSRILRSRVMRDSLTNLYNHTMIHHQLEREITICDHRNMQLSIVLFDIDHFKNVNDTYGHQAGDKVLKDLSVFLHNNLRKTDLIGRYGGEEFLVVLPNTDAQDALKIINTLREKFAETPHILGDNQRIFVTISGGVASHKDFKTVANLIKAADEALYRAKEEGRNKVELAVPAN